MRDGEKDVCERSGAKDGDVRCAYMVDSVG